MGIFRLPNLLIVALTQYLLQYLVLLPALRPAGLWPSLDHWHFFLFVVCTLLITAGGYIINDVLDYDADLVNKPEKVFITASFSKQKALLLYFLTMAVGFALAWHLALFVNKPILILLYPAAVGGLWLYSRFFKKMPLLGNLVVALFCAGVAGILLFAERLAYQDIRAAQPALAGRITVLFGGYLVFAFLSTLVREIVKDIEDLQGDKAAGWRTLPVAFGVQAAKRVAGFFACVLGLLLLAFCGWLYRSGEMAGLFFTAGCILAPLCYLILLLGKARQKSDYSKLSQLAKFVMAAGLGLLVLISL